jgi:hypothetical protein
MKHLANASWKSIDYVSIGIDENLQSVLRYRAKNQSVFMKEQLREFLSR